MVNIFPTNDQELSALVKKEHNSSVLTSAIFQLSLLNKLWILWFADNRVYLNIYHPKTFHQKLYQIHVKLYTLLDL